MRNSVQDDTHLDKNREVREDFEVGRILLRYSIEKNISGFSLSGLRVPTVLYAHKIGNTSLDITDHAVEICLFEEHLYDRIVSLTDNIRLQKTIWDVNERTREYRECELHSPSSAKYVVDAILQLMDALFAEDRPLALRIIDDGFERRMSSAEAIAAQLSSQQNEAGLSSWTSS